VYGVLTSVPADPPYAASELAAQALIETLVAWEQAVSKSLPRPAHFAVFAAALEQRAEFRRQERELLRTIPPT
jgi:hypothetical protein